MCSDPYANIERIRKLQLNALKYGLKWTLTERFAGDLKRIALTTIKALKLAHSIKEKV